MSMEVPLKGKKTGKGIQFTRYPIFSRTLKPKVHEAAYRSGVRIIAIDSKGGFTLFVEKGMEDVFWASFR
jgi:hypothetical protein